MAASRWLVLASCLVLVYSVFTAVLAITLDWPAEFGTSPEDDPETIAQWIVHGSLVSAPLAPIVAQIVLTGLALLRRPGWRIASGLGFVVLGVVYLIGNLGEPLDPERSDQPVLAYIALRGLGIAAAVALVGLGAWTAARAVREYRERR